MKIFSYFLLIMNLGFFTAFSQDTITSKKPLSRNDSGINETEILSHFNSAITTISTNPISQVTVNSPSQLLLGKVAGMQVIQGNGAPGSTPKIYLRGIADLNYFEQPLYVIDGIPQPIEVLDGIRNPLNSLNPLEIDKIEVVRDPSASFLYGCRAANGAILITTKKGVAARPLKIQYANAFSISKVTKKTDVYDAEGFRNMLLENLPGSDPLLNQLGGSNTDWQSEIYRKAYGFNHHLSAWGGLKNMPYHATFGITDQEGIMLTDHFKRLSMSAGIDPSLLKNHLNIHLDFKGSRIDNRIANPDAAVNALYFDPTKPVFDPASPFGGYTTYTYDPDYGGSPINGWAINPVALLNLTNDRAAIDRNIYSYGFDYKVHNFEQLKFSARFSGDKTSSDRNILIPGYASWVYHSDTLNGYISESHGEIKNTFGVASVELLQPTDTYGSTLFMKFSAWAQSIDIIRNSSYQPLNGGYPGFDWTENGGVGYGYNNINGMLSYNFRNLYKATIGFAKDGNSHFSLENRFTNNWLASFEWIVSNETFIKNSQLLSLLKLRISYFTNSRKEVEYLPGTLHSPATTGLNAGLDFGLWGNRVNGSIDIYNKKTQGFLMWIPVVSGTSLTEKVLNNEGDVLNRGIELNLNCMLTNKSELKWDFNLNFAYNKNEVTYLHSHYINPTNGYVILSEIPYYFFYWWGKMIGEGSSIFTYLLNEQVYDPAGNPIEGLYVIQGSGASVNPAFAKIPEKSDFPYIVLGFGSNLNWKKIEVAFWGRAQTGNYLFNYLESQSSMDLRVFDATQPVSFYNSVIPSENIHFQERQDYSDYYLRPAGFLRLDELMLAYNFGELMKTNLKLKVYVAAHNLFVISNYSGADPELQGGVDYGLYLRPRKILFGIVLDI
ncbi:MAG TPA: TonB-dependent receptor plug domain-containing protein [Bacteroidales bacterium]|nr:TonB-dependent receptor plug domain-containing protein [Bacteroidales bacterium]HRX95497.1 TonB-dependent receptor plug domain-containing protein [Bacteroidales bacterium]